MKTHPFIRSLPAKCLFALVGIVNQIVHQVLPLLMFLCAWGMLAGLIGLFGPQKLQALSMLAASAATLVGLWVLYRACFWLRHKLGRAWVCICPECGVLAGEALTDQIQDREYAYEVDESYLEPNGGLYGYDGPQQTMKWRKVTRTGVCRDHFLQLRCGRCSHEWRDEYVE